MKHALILLVACMLVICDGCDLAYPEVAVINKTAQQIIIKNPSFNGCIWNMVLAYGEATATGRCLPGEDRVHFQKLDVQAYCQEQTEDGTIPGVCPCDESVGSESDAELDPGLINTEPLWFNYETISIKHVDYGQFHVFEITLDDMEQDFSVPGPYGH